LAGTRADLAKALGTLETGTRLRVDFEANGAAQATGEDAVWARTFGETAPGAPLVYEDSSGQLAYADNQGSVARRLGIALDRRLSITSG
jgi:S-adenosylmethionine hydrolase